MLEMECDICAYWQREQEESATGLCRRHSPSVVGTAESVGVGLWPITNSDDWCGEYERKNGQ